MLVVKVKKERLVPKEMLDLLAQREEQVQLVTKGRKVRKELLVTRVILVQPGMMDLMVPRDKREK